jgi:hypothetical protein
MDYLHFLFALRRLRHNRDWQVDEVDKVAIRLSYLNRDCDYCPLTAVARQQAQKDYHVTRWSAAVEALDFYSKAVSPYTITDAADFQISADPALPQVRRHLRYFLGLPKER